jgi:branched-chain amino acid transport system ATP-binding protein
MLELQSITGGYYDEIVLQNVSIAVPPASVVALIGPNGAGKTTTLRMAAGLLHPRTGSVILDGSDVTTASPSSRAKRGMCFVEGRAVFPSLSVRENVVLFSPRGKETAAFDEAAAEFPILGKRRNQQAGTLSGGEQQMLALARAYVTRPQLLLVDEPSLGLAPFLVDAIFSFLRRLAARNISVLLVEQYVNRALAIAGFVYVLQKGAVSYSGASSDVNEDQIFAIYSGEV